MRKTKTEPRPCLVDRDGEAAIRHFIQAIDEWSLPLKATTVFDLYDVLGYKAAPNGAWVNKNREIVVRYGQECTVEDEFYSDWQEITDAEIAEAEGSSEPGASESS